MRGTVLVHLPGDAALLPLARAHCHLLPDLPATDADIVFATHPALSALPPLPHLTVPRVLEIIETEIMGTIKTEDGWLRARRRVMGGIQTVRVPTPVVLGMLPSALPPAPLAFTSPPPPEPYTPPQRETIMLADAAAAAALLHDLLHTPDDPRLTVEAFTADDAPPLAEAPVVVGGGKGLAAGDKRTPFAERVQHNFVHLLSPVAAALGGALAASRAIIDAAGIDPAYQIGQSGLSIAPDVYVAVGVSGAVQHLQGVQHARVILAVNDDPDAPIFRAAHYGLLGDVRDVVPALLRSLGA